MLDLSETERPSKHCTFCFFVCSCLSAITLASKCMAPAFRMHVRAHGTVAKFFRALHDATKDQVSVGVLICSGECC